MKSEIRLRPPLKEKDVPSVSLEQARILAKIVLGMKAKGELGPRQVSAWMVRLADVFVQAGSWTGGFVFLAKVPRGYLRHLPDDAAQDPELAARALRLSRWLANQFGFEGLEEPPVNLFLRPGVA